MVASKQMDGWWSQLFTVHLFGMVHGSSTTGPGAEPEERLALHGFDVVVPAREEDRRLGGTNSWVALGAHFQEESC